MTAHLKSFALLTQFLFQRLAFALFILAALALSAATIGAALGGCHGLNSRPGSAA